MTKRDAEGVARRLIADASGLPPERVDLDLPLQHYGIDSLLELELLLAAPQYFGHLDTEGIPLPKLGHDVVHYIILNESRAGPDGDASGMNRSD